MFECVCVLVPVRTRHQTENQSTIEGEPGAGTDFIPLVDRQPGPGFSLVEVLVASLLLTVSVLAILPLAQRSIRNNWAGRDATLSVNMARSRLEELRRVPFGDPRLAIESGTSRVLVERRPLREGGWVEATEGEQPPSTGHWQRVTIVRQYGSGALSGSDGQVRGYSPETEVGLIHPDEALSAGADPVTVAFKQIEVQVSRSDARSAAALVTLQTLRAK